jgi:two-component system chemotaxis sensor kinase CheA
LAIARENIERIGGTISVETTPGKGVQFNANVPASLLRIRGVVVRIEEQHYIIPSVYVEKVIRVRNEQINTVQGRQTIDLNGAPAVLMDLAAALKTGRTAPLSRAVQPAVILHSAGRRAAFLVDEILQDQDIVVKPLGKRLQNARAFAGAALLGSGETALVLNGTCLLDAPGGFSAETVANAAPARKPRSCTILLVEDSITSRTLLRSILQAAGYNVKIAVDGLEALATLKLEKIDLVISDVQMPRMDGFELTRQMRRTVEFKELPVILITSLGSREDKERGVEAGANAYLVKGALEQGNFLHTIRRFIS